MKRRVYVVDDEEPIRRSTRLMLTVQGYEVSAFENGAALIEVCTALKPGAVLLDMRMPGIDGLEVQRALLARTSPHSVVVMSGHGDLAVAAAALRKGAVAFLEKPFARAAIDRALAAAFLKLEDPAGHEAELARARARVMSLSEGERGVLAGLARGSSNEAIAAGLGLSIQSVDARRARLFADLGVDTLPDALALAFAAGLGAMADE